MQPTVVIVEDDKDLCELLTHSLKDLDARVFVAHDGNDGLAMIESEKPNVIITDYHLPGMDGLALLKKLKEKRIYTPCIWISGVADEKVFQEAKKLGVFHVQEKPLVLDNFKNIVESAIVEGLGFIKLRSDKPQRNVKQIAVSVGLDPEFYKEIENAAELLGVSVSDYLRSIIEKEFGKKAS